MYKQKVIQLTVMMTAPGLITRQHLLSIMIKLLIYTMMLLKGIEKMGVLVSNIIGLIILESIIKLQTKIKNMSFIAPKLKYLILVVQKMSTRRMMHKSLL